MAHGNFPVKVEVMEYAIQLLLPILGGLWLGNWLTRTYGVDPIWTMWLGILGMALGLGVLYKRYALRPPKAFPPPKTTQHFSGKMPPGSSSPPQASDPEKRLEWHELDFLYKLEERPEKKKRETDNDGDSSNDPG